MGEVRWIGRQALRKERRTEMSSETAVVGWGEETVITGKMGYGPGMVSKVTSCSILWDR